jgi:hypothetical protein
MKKIREFFAMLAGVGLAVIVLALSPILVAMILLTSKDTEYSESRIYEQ